MTHCPHEAFQKQRREFQAHWPHQRGARAREQANERESERDRERARKRERAGEREEREREHARARAFIGNNDTLWPSPGTSTKREEKRLEKNKKARKKRRKKSRPDTFAPSSDRATEKK